ncbi:acyl-CoA dehydrogenase C-terminal domain-containing protein [Ruegeria lacuscaerulensis]|uniref:acyl-CoA dehydrogenase C-terminal domain-containing protein n=1 Tax=Ruegeria lacuscaerulensis TaxID=55218 RepID=UPI001479BDDB|nr:acyl-CoA dehydrogenase C-terminal domain-containing protein [Ruegeria lacuscaerulensis]
MLVYSPPLRDARFVVEEVLDYDAHLDALDTDFEADVDLMTAIMEEAGKFAEQEVAPLYRIGDTEGCRLENGNVKTPTGFAEAYAKFTENGWSSISGDPDFGGQGLPASFGTAVSEFMATANWAWTMYPVLSHGALETINRHGSMEQKQKFLGPLISGDWTGTMCLTEPQCGTDLGLVRTRAEPNADGSYAITGSKIFISCGDHDLAENIVHIVLARLPGAPKGTKGISLFIVPKFNVDDEGSVTDRNGVVCSSLEEKHGIHGSSTCVLNFDQARGFLIGPENRGLACMFTFMNVARLGVAQQGVAHAERAYQGSLAYARERLQMRAAEGAHHPERAADPIIVHPDVRRMLLTQRAVAEGGRCLVLHCAKLVDTVETSADPEMRRAADAMLSLLTPIAKAFLTEAGYEAASYGVQIFGGHGYISEWGMEQNLRDARISTLYEGTTGIQALDLLGRKILLDGGAALGSFIDEIQSFCRTHAGTKNLGGLLQTLHMKCDDWRKLTQEIAVVAQADPNEVGAASVDYLMYSGYVTLSFFWAKSAVAAQQALDAGSTELSFYKGKLATARFCFEKLLPRTLSLAASIQSGSDSLMEIGEDEFAA